MKSKKTNLVSMVCVLCCGVFFITAVNAETGVVADVDAELDKDIYNLSLEELMEVNIDVASTRPSTLFNSVSVVSTIDRKTIELYGFKSIDDALVTVSGFDVQRSYLKQSIPTSRGVLQDHYANKVLFMIDGIPNWQAFGGDPIMGRIDINDVERIEVLKGPASVLYGTNAYVGAINVVLKKDPVSRVSASVGTDDMRAAGIAWRGELDEGRYSLAVNHRNKEEFSWQFTDEEGQTGPIDEYQRNTNIHADWVVQNHQFTLNYYDGEESYYGSNVAFSGGAGTNHTVDGFFLNYRYELESDDWGNFEFNALLDNQKTEFDVNTIPTRLFWEGVKTTFSLKNLYDFDDNWHLESGLDFEDRDSKNSRFMDPNGLVDVNGIDKTVEESSAFVQLYYTSEKHNWVVGGRVVDNQLFGQNISGRATYVYMIDETNSVKVIAGQSFRSASLFELYGRIGCCILGQENLEPEEADSLEVSYISAWDAWLFQSTVYWAQYANKIVRGIEFNVELPDGRVLDSVNRYRNGERFAAIGAEMELKYTADDWSSFVNLTYVDGNDNDKFLDEDHYNFKYVPDMIVSAGLARKWENWSLAVNGTYRGSSKSITDGVSSSFIADMTLTYHQQLASGSPINHQLVWRNVSDEEVTVPEYARRRTVDEIPLRYEQAIAYEVSWGW